MHILLGILAGAGIIWFFADHPGSFKRFLILATMVWSWLAMSYKWDELWANYNYFLKWQANNSSGIIVSEPTLIQVLPSGIIPFLVMLSIYLISKWIRTGKI